MPAACLLAQVLHACFKKRLLPPSEMKARRHRRRPACRFPPPHSEISSLPGAVYFG